MAKCPYCKQVVTLDKTTRESADISAPEAATKEVPGLVKKKSCIAALTANRCWVSVSFLDAC